jgi:hypothetical protein
MCSGQTKELRTIEPQPVQKGSAHFFNPDAIKKQLHGSGVSLSLFCNR